MRKHDRANSRFNLQTANSRYEFTIPRRDAPELCMSLSPNRGRGECRVPAAPAASCAKCDGGTRVSSPQVHRSHPAFPHAMVLTAYFVLSPATNSSCHRHQRIKACLSPVGPTRLRQLDTSNGCQDHTASPSATTSFVCAPLITHGSFANPPCDHIARPTLPRPPHPIPRP